MLGIELPLIVAEEPLVARYPPAVIEYADPVYRDLDTHLEPHVAYRHRVVVLVDDDRRVLVDLCFRDIHVAQRHGGQRDEVFPFPLKEAVDILRAAFRPVGAVAKARLKEPLVEFLEALHDGYGDKVIAPDIPDHPFGAALLMGGSRVAEAGIEVIIGPQLAEALLLDPAVSLKDLLNGTRQVVIDDDGEDTAEEPERVNMGIEERLLLLAGVGAYKGLGGELRAHAEEVKGGTYSPHYRNSPSPVGLGLLSAFGLQDQICAGCLHTFFCLYLAHITAHGHFAPRVSFLLDEACVDPAGGVPLFFRVLEVFLQPALYGVPVLLENGICLRRSPSVLGELTLKDLSDRHT